MSLKAVLAVNGLARLRLGYQFGRTFASSIKEDSISADDKPIFAEDILEKEEEIMQKRNKSNLREPHRNLLFGQKPYSEPVHWSHDTLQYRRRMLGRYGVEGSGESPSIAWPTAEELEDAKEYEKVAYPLSLQESWAEIEKKNKEKKEAIAAREKAILSKLAKMDEWRTALYNRLENQRKEKEEAIARKERLIEEVRRHFGFKIDVHDARFKEALAKKETEDKKLRKEAKKKMKEEKLRARLEALNAKTAKMSEEANKNKENNETETSNETTEASQEDVR